MNKPSLLSRESFRESLSRESPRVLFRFASGGGFCAEMVKLVSVLVAALCHGYGFRMQQGAPKGFGVQRGWCDYFEECFLVEELPIVGFLNNPAARLVNRTKATRIAATQLMRLLAKKPVPIFYRDFNTQLEFINQDVFGADVDFWHAASQVLDIIWRPSPEVSSEIKAHAALLGLESGGYQAMHIRRGDKRTEMTLPDLSEFSSAANAGLPTGALLYICGDDLGAIEAVSAKLRADIRLVVSHHSRPSGYDQTNFNELPASLRYQETIGMLNDLEVLCGAASIIGSLKSNVLGLVRMRRPDKPILEVCGV